MHTPVRIHTLTHEHNNRFFFRQKNQRISFSRLLSKTWFWIIYFSQVLSNDFSGPPFRHFVKCGYFPNTKCFLSNPSQRYSNVRTTQQTNRNAPFIFETSGLKKLKESILLKDVL